MEMEEVIKMCVICLKNYTERENFIFLPLSKSELDNETYLDKIHYMVALDKELEVFQETWEVCFYCSENLNKACEFRKKLDNAVEFWNDWKIKAETQEGLKIDEYSKYEMGVDAVTRYTDHTYLNGITVEDVSSEKVDESLTTYSSDVLHRIFSNPKDKVELSNSFLCELCDAAFTSKRNFNKHIKCHHTLKKEYVCNDCNKAFKHSHNLEEHLATHTGERNFTCEVCGKTFHRASSHHRHMKSHSAPPGEKVKKSPFLCSVCGKSFPYSNGFQRHMRIHFAEKRHRCNICGRTFSQSTHLKVHMRTHSGEKPFRCSVCQVSFSHNATLRKHVKCHKDSKDFVKVIQNLEPNLGQGFSNVYVKSEEVRDDLRSVIL